jgi:hypothetical protein
VSSTRQQLILAALVSGITEGRWTLIAKPPPTVVNRKAPSPWPVLPKKTFLGLGVRQIALGEGANTHCPDGAHTVCRRRTHCSVSVCPSRRPQTIFAAARCPKVCLQPRPLPRPTTPARPPPLPAGLSSPSWFATGRSNGASKSIDPALHLYVARRETCEHVREIVCAHQALAAHCNKSAPFLVHLAVEGVAKSSRLFGEFKRAFRQSGGQAWLASERWARRAARSKRARAAARKQTVEGLAVEASERRTAERGGRRTRNPRGVPLGSVWAQLWFGVLEKGVF